MQDNTTEELFMPATRFGSVAYEASATYLVSLQKNPFFMGVVCTAVINSTKPQKVYSFLSSNNIICNDCRQVTVQRLGASQIGVTFRGIIPFTKELEKTKDACINYADMYLRDARSLAAKCGEVM